MTDSAGKATIQYKNQTVASKLQLFSQTQAAAPTSLRQSATTTRTIFTEELSANVYPNPSSSQFTLVIQTISKEPVQVTVFDLAGRVVENRAGLQAGTFTFGQSFRNGIYLLQVVQGEQRTQMRITKL
jgi:hypothetical protein